MKLLGRGKISHFDRSNLDLHRSSSQPPQTPVRVLHLAQRYREVASVGESLLRDSDLDPLTSLREVGESDNIARLGGGGDDGEGERSLALRERKGHAPKGRRVSDVFERFSVERETQTNLEIDFDRNLASLTSPNDLLPSSTTKDELSPRERMNDLSDVLHLPFLVEIDSERVVRVGEGLPLVEVGSFDFLLESELLLETVDGLGSVLRFGGLNSLSLNLVREFEGRSSTKGKRGDESKFSSTASGGG